MRICVPWSLFAIILSSYLIVACDVGTTAMPRLIPTPTTATAPIEFVTLEPRVVTLEVGQTQQFLVTAYDQFERPMSEIKVVFTSEHDAGQIDSQGNFTAGTKAGIHTRAVTVEVTQGTTTKTATSNISILPGPPRLCLFGAFRINGPSRPETALHRLRLRPIREHHSRHELFFQC